MNRQIRDRRTGMRLTKKIDSRHMVRHTERSDQLYVTMMMLVVERG